MTTEERERIAAVKRNDRYYAEVYKQGFSSRSGVRNPHLISNDIRAYTTWAAGVSDR